MSKRSCAMEHDTVRDAATTYPAAPSETETGPVLRGYKRTEVGVIPEDWEVTTVRDLSPFVTSGSRGWARFYSDVGALFLRITNLSRSSIKPDLSDIKFVALPAKEFAESKRTSVQTGDLLISITADIGIVGFVDSVVPKPAYLNQHLALIRFDQEKISSKYSAYYLASEAPQALFLASMDVGAKAGMNLNTIRRLLLALPPVPDQPVCI